MAADPHHQGRKRKTRKVIKEAKEERLSKKHSLEANKILLKRPS